MHIYGRNIEVRNNNPQQGTRYNNPQQGTRGIIFLIRRSTLSLRPSSINVMLAASGAPPLGPCQPLWVNASVIAAFI